MRLSERTHCPVCQSSKGNIIYSIGYGSMDVQSYLHSFYDQQGYPVPETLATEDFQLKECGTCRLVFQARIPDSPSLNELYSEWISYDKVYRHYASKWDMGRYDGNYMILRALLEHFRSCDFSIFDYGFGYASLLKQAMIMGIRTYGTEFNVRQMELARSAGIGIVDFATDAEVPKVDAIFCEQVLEHVVDPREIMANLAKLARKGTILHLSVPNCRDVHDIIKHIDWTNIKGNRLSVNAFAPLEHINSFSSEQLTRLALDFGFEPFTFARHPKLAWMEQGSLKTARNLLKEGKKLLRTMIKGSKASTSTARFFIYRND